MPQTTSSKDLTIPIANCLLAALPPDEYDRLVPKLETVRLPKNRILYEAGDPTRYAYFLNTGMASLLAIADEGQSIETAGSVMKASLVFRLFPKQEYRPTG